MQNNSFLFFFAVLLGGPMDPIHRFGKMVAIFLLPSVFELWGDGREVNLEFESSSGIGIVSGKSKVRAGELEGQNMNSSHVLV